MDTKYEVIITNKAKRDLKEIYNYISKSLMAKQAADNLMNEFEKNILMLEDMPESCSIIEYYKKRKYPNCYRTNLNTKCRTY